MFVTVGLEYTGDVLAWQPALRVTLRSSTGIYWSQVTGLGPCLTLRNMSLTPSFEVQ